MTRKSIFNLNHKPYNMTQKQRDYLLVFIIILIALLIENLIKF